MVDSVYKNCLLGLDKRLKLNYIVINEEKLIVLHIFQFFFSNIKHNKQ